MSQNSSDTHRLPPMWNTRATSSLSERAVPAKALPSERSRRRPLTPVPDRPSCTAWTLPEARSDHCPFYRPYARLSMPVTENELPDSFDISAMLPMSAPRYFRPSRRVLSANTAPSRHTNHPTLPPPSRHSNHPTLPPPPRHTNHPTLLPLPHPPTTLPQPAPPTLRSLPRPLSPSQESSSSLTGWPRSERHTSSPIVVGSSRLSPAWQPSVAGSASTLLSRQIEAEQSHRHCTPRSHSDSPCDSPLPPTTLSRISRRTCSRTFHRGAASTTATNVRSLFPVAALNLPCRPPPPPASGISCAQPVRPRHQKLHVCPNLSLLQPSRHRLRDGPPSASPTTPCNRSGCPWSASASSPAPSGRGAQPLCDASSPPR